MSKRNKNKNRFAGQVQTPAVDVEKSAPSEVPTKAKPDTENLSYDMQKEFRNLGLIILFILALLIGLFEYDKETHILRTLTSKLFNL